jgi:hypothetical protein
MYRVESTSDVKVVDLNSLPNMKINSDKLIKVIMNTNRLSLL